MAYSKFEFFDNLGQGQGTLPEYGTAPRTYEGDLALLTNCPGYSSIRKVNARVKGTPHELTIWVGIKKTGESLSDSALTEKDVVPYVALACPPYVRPLLGFVEIDKVIEVLA